MKLNFDIDKIRLRKSIEKINQHPEIRGLLVAECSKKLTLRFAGVNGPTVTFKVEGSQIEEDIKHKHLVSFYYDTYYIPIKNYLQFEQELKEKYDLKIINFEPLHKPFWEIERDYRIIKIKWNPITNSYGSNYSIRELRTIPGIVTREKFYTIPLSEGWRLYEMIVELLDDPTIIVIQEDLIEEIKKEFDKRLRVREIHEAEDSEVDYSFENNKDFQLRPHQRVALEFQDLVGHKTIIAYGTGTGKTAIGIAGALRANAQKILVVCTGALRLNWRNHIYEHTREEPLILAGRIPIDEDYKYLLLKQPKWVVINYDILRTKLNKPKEDGEKNPYTKTDPYFPWTELLNLYEPDYIIVDESHHLKNPASNQSQAFRRLESKHKTALSATPIINKHGELWSILNWLHPEQFPFYETFLTQYGSGRYIADEDAKNLRSLLDTIMIRRTRKDISKNLPPIGRIVETFEMSGRARKIYERILDGIYKEMQEFDHMGIGGQERRFKSILPKLNAMIKVCAADKVKSTVERAVEISESIEDDEWNKVLIFTHFKGTCNTIARMLGHEALTFVSRTNRGFNTANFEERMRVVEQFQKDDSYKYLIATNQSAAEGLDITKAGVVLFNDLFWTPAAHLQCEGRAFYRESDLHGGDSYYFQFNNSIEEWITELQGIKKNTIDKVVEGKGMGYSVTNEIMDRLKELFKNRTRGSY